MNNRLLYLGKVCTVLITVFFSQFQTQICIYNIHTLCLLWIRVGNLLFHSSLFRSLLFCSSLFCNSLFRPSLFRSKLLILKRDREWLAKVALCKRATVSDSLTLLVTKDEQFAGKICIFVCFWQFCPRANRQCRSSLICSFLKSDLSNLLPSLTKTSDSLEEPMSEFTTLLWMHIEAV